MLTKLNRAHQRGARLVVARRMLETCHPGGDNPDITLAANPIKFSATPTTLYHPPPTLGAHNAEVLAEFGIQPPEDQN